MSVGEWWKMPETADTYNLIIFASICRGLLKFAGVEYRLTGLIICAGICHGMDAYAGEWMWLR